MSARTLIDVLRLNEQEVFYASTAAWLLDPRGSHGLGRRFIEQLAKFVQVHRPELATSLFSPTLPVKCVLKRPGPAPQLQLTVGTTRLALVFTTHDALGPQDRPAAGFVPIAVGFDDSNSNRLLTWPLGQLYLALEGAQPAPRWVHFVETIREHLGKALSERDIDPAAIADPVAQLPELPAIPRPAPGPSLTGFGGGDGGSAYGGAGWGADDASATPAAAGPSGLGGSLADQWELPVEPDEPAPAPKPAPEPAPLATATMLDAASLDLNADVQFAGANTLLDAAGATMLEGIEAPRGQTTARLERSQPQNQAMLRLLNELQKGIGFYRLYPQEHPFCAQAVEDTNVAFHSYFELFGAMEMRVDRDGVYLNETLIQADSGEMGSFVSLLYPEGIRSMTFERGLEAREVHSFIEALSGQQDGDVAMGNDLLSNLWRRDFSHIIYLTYDQLSPQGLKNVRDPLLMPLAKRIQQLVGGMNAVEDPDTEFAGFLSTLGPVDTDQPTTWATIPERAEAFCGSPVGRTRQLFRAKLLDKFLGDTLGRAADVLSWANTHEEYSSNQTDEAHFMAGLVMNALWQDKLDTAIDVIARAAGTDAGALMSDELLLRLGTEQCLTVFARTLLQHKKLGPVQLFRKAMGYLSRLKPESFDTVCRIAVLQVDEDVRGVFFKFIASQATIQAKTVDRMSLRITDRYCAELCKALERTDGGKKLLKGFAADKSNPERAKFAYSSVGKATGTFSREKDLHILESYPIKKERMGAAKRVLAANDPRAFEGLKTLVASKAFAKRDQDELDAIFRALITIGGPRAIAVLSEISKRKPGMFGKADTIKVAKSATRWLLELRNQGLKKK